MLIFFTKSLAIVEGELFFGFQPNKCQILLACPHFDMANFSSQPIKPYIFLPLSLAIKQHPIGQNSGSIGLPKIHFFKIMSSFPYKTG
jgi:hypothetical protein